MKGTGKYEAARLLRLIEELDPECARLVVKAIEQYMRDSGGQSIQYVYMQILSAIPNAALSGKEKELLLCSSTIAKEGGLNNGIHVRMPDM